MVQDLRIAVPVCARDTAGAVEKMERAAALANLVEIRLDVMEKFDLREILERAPKPVIVTYRSRKEGGNGRANYGTRIRLLREAIEKGTDFVDVEFSMPLIYREPLFRDRGKNKDYRLPASPQRDPIRKDPSEPPCKNGGHRRRCCQDSNPGKKP